MSKSWDSWRGRVLFARDLWQWRKLGGQRPSKLWPIYRDRFKEAADLGDYFHQDLWAARKVFAARPARHIDVGSRIDGFVGHLLTFMAVEQVDIRPLANPPQGLHLIHADAVTMQGFPDDSLLSISSLHAAEHFGLGRYGDPIDPGAHIKFMRSLQRVLAPGGHLYFSVPIGPRDEVHFHAERVLNASTVMQTFDQLTLASFGKVTSGGGLIEAATSRDMDSAGRACGLFEFTKEA
jgi:SAM-dependent methyltransferase